jgi:hypothetical protein
LERADAPDEALLAAAVSDRREFWHQTQIPLISVDFCGLLHAQLEGDLGEGFSFGVIAQPRLLLFGDPVSGFHPCFALRGPLEVVTILHILILAQDALRPDRREPRRERRRGRNRVLHDASHLLPPLPGVQEKAVGAMSGVLGRSGASSPEVLGEIVVIGAFGTCNLEPDYPGPFIGMGATYELDSEAYTWTDVPAPDDPLRDTWREGDQVVRVCRKSRSSRWGRRAARPAGICTTHGW